MKRSGPSQPAFPHRVSSPSGLGIELNSNGSIRRIDHGDVMINLFLGNEAEGGLSNIHLRRLGPAVETNPLLGPGSPAVWAPESDGLAAIGTWGDIHYKLRLTLSNSASAWFWHVELENKGPEEIECDLIHTQDIGLAHYGAIRLNEFYVSQYIDHTPLEHARCGAVIASRQNQSMGGSCPWLVIGSLGRGVSYATDALQFHDLAVRAGGQPPALATGLPGERLQHEHSMVSIQDEPIVLAPGATAQRGFFASFTPNQMGATSAEDLSRVDAALALTEARFPSSDASLPDISCGSGLFSNSRLLESFDLDDGEIPRFFPDGKRHGETKDGILLSFFTGGNSHVVLKAKELQVLRPHGSLLRSGGSMIADESALTSTAWMSGVFHSMVTQGHVSINRFLSTCHTYLGLFRSHGQRVFVEIDGEWRLLGIPSAFEMAPDSCRWIYKHHGGIIEVRSNAPDECHELRLTISVLEGPPARFLITHHIAINGDDGSPAIPIIKETSGNGIFVRPIPDCDVGRRFPSGGFLISPSEGTIFESIHDDEILFSDRISRQQPYLCLVTELSLTAGLVIEGRLVESTPSPNPQFWETITADLAISAPAAADQAPAADRMAEIFPWFIQNALVHYLSPRGLEQYSGGGWGTRDICQGPTELLLALGHFDPLRDLLLRVFRQQNADGDWPQWFMFFDRERNIRPGDSHGDIVYWPVLALAQYLAATGDSSLLDESLPFFDHDPATAETATIWQHVERAIDLMLRRVITGTSLAAYGHGDWNDSLQPAKPDMRERLCSSWTVTLNYQVFIALGTAFRKLGNESRAAEFEAMAANILEEFQRVLIPDDVVTGLAYFHEGGKIDHLLHPRDGTTGLSYSLLPMIHAIINDMFSARQAEAHLAIIGKHLSGPDGARLFDRPLAYHGGPQTYFQRAESATYFGREIGIMYTHAHLRYCEALAHFGDAERFFDALCRINPIGVRDIVPSAGLRQANCYYSSSDAAFTDRYDAFENYGKINQGEVTLEGGWRVYSSGAGISVRLIMQCFLGIRIERGHLVVDPVIPRSLDGLEARLVLLGKRLTVSYCIQQLGRGTETINLNGVDLDFIRESNPYRPGAARVALAALMDEMAEEENHMVISIS